MQLILKFLRSIITSLSFFIITILLIICIIVSSIKSYDKPISKYININRLIKITMEDSLLWDTNYYNITYNYIDDYINYLFYKNSYPSIKEENNLKLTKEEKKDLERLKNNIDLSYINVIRIREINNFLTNGSIHFLVKSFILFFSIIICLLYCSLSKGLVKLSKGFMLSGVLSLLLIVVVNELVLKMKNIFVQSVFISLIDKSFLRVYFNYCIIYILSGFILWVIELIFLNKKIKNLHFFKN